MGFEAFRMVRRLRLQKRTRRMSLHIAHMDNMVSLQAFEEGCNGDPE